MTMQSLERRTSLVETCAVCGGADARTLSYTRLEDGTRVTVCGSHKVAHRRQARLARSTEELRVMLGERRVG